MLFVILLVHLCVYVCPCTTIELSSTKRTRLSPASSFPLSPGGFCGSTCKFPPFSLRDATCRVICTDYNLFSPLSCLGCCCLPSVYKALFFRLVKAPGKAEGYPATSPSPTLPSVTILPPPHPAPRGSPLSAQPLLPSSLIACDTWHKSHPAAAELHSILDAFL